MEFSPVPSKIEFLDGGIGDRYVTIRVISQPVRYINTLFQFFTSQSAIENEPKLIKEFFETKFDVNF